MPLYWIPLLFCALLVLSSARALWWALACIQSFDRSLRALPRDLPPLSPFDDGNPVGKAANEYVALFSLCTQRGALGAFSVANSAAVVHARMRMITSQARNLTGVIILCGLLVTLFTLQESVGVLGEAFRHLSTGQATSDPSQAGKDVQLIQVAMGDIAQTAKVAFKMSGGVILVAALILWLSLMVQRRGQSSMLEFSDWANAAYMEALSARPTDQFSQIQKFGEMIESMGTMMGSFEQVAASMSSAGDLGSKLDASAQIVAQAVKQLPESINASVVQLSAEVTKDISVHLQHQIEHLQKILAIYGDQEGRVRKIQECLDSFAASVAASSAAVTGLKLLPEKIDSLTITIATASKGAKKVESAAQDLSRKVDELPIIQFREVLVEIAALKEDLPRSVRAAVENGFSGLEKRISSASNPEQIVSELRKLRAIIEGLPEMVDQTQIRALLLRLEALITEAGKSKGLIDRLWGR